MSKNELMKKIQELSFVKTELELFLNTHPNCRAALDYYHKIIEELDIALTEYQNRFGPIVAEASSADRWNWIDGPWPWHLDNGNGNGNGNENENGRRKV